MKTVAETYQRKENTQIGNRLVLYLMQFAVTSVEYVKLIQIYLR